MITSLAFTLCLLHGIAALPGDLRCEWQVNPKNVRVPCPQFSWEVPAQSRFRLAVARSPEGLAHPLWETSRADALTVAEYQGPRLESKATYYWKVWVWDAAGKTYDEPPVQNFIVEPRSMPQHLPSVRTFINFGGSPQWARDRIDLCFRREAKRGRANILALQYALVCTVVVPSPRADRLAEFCRSQGYELEDCFCHFAADTRVTLHVGAERADRPQETRLCRGWDLHNDRNGDGWVDDDEAARLVNPRATARQRREARVPIYYWGPPADDFVANPGHRGYQRFMAEIDAPSVAQGHDGIFFDTLATRPPVAGRGPLLEYAPGNQQDWLRDVQQLLARIKTRLPDKLITGNGWGAEPMVIDGLEAENWLHIGSSEERWRTALDAMVAMDRRGKVQMNQYNPIYDPKLAEFGVKVEGVTPERDKIYGLATYLLGHGGWTYFGIGSHPYHQPERHWFKAIEHDIGQPSGDYLLLSRSERRSGPGGPNLLTNGGFEQAGPPGKPSGWKLAEPIVLDSQVKHAGRYSVRILSTSTQVNNINYQYVTLKPHTRYTLSGWIRVDNVQGSPGVNLYAYEFRGMKDPAGGITVKGSGDWRLLRHVFTTGEGERGRINFRMFGATGTAWLDDLELVEGAIYSDAVYARKYTRGMVLVKPSTGAGYGEDTRSEIRLDRAYQALAADGSLGPATDRVSMRSGEGAILVLFAK